MDRRDDCADLYRPVRLSAESNAGRLRPQRRPKLYYGRCKPATRLLTRTNDCDNESGREYCATAAGNELGGADRGLGHYERGKRRLLWLALYEFKAMGRGQGQPTFCGGGY